MLSKILDNLAGLQEWPIIHIVKRLVNSFHVLFWVFFVLQQFWLAKEKRLDFFIFF
jgi:hypothetical protein